MSRICSRRRETSEERVRPEAYSSFGANNHSKMWSERKRSSVVTMESVFSQGKSYVAPPSSFHRRIQLSYSSCCFRMTCGLLKSSSRGPGIRSVKGNEYYRHGEQNMRQRRGPQALTLSNSRLSPDRWSKSVRRLGEPTAVHKPQAPRLEKAMAVTFGSSTRPAWRCGGALFMAYGNPV